MHLYNIIGKDQRIRTYLPVFIHSYCSNYKQPLTIYKNGIFVHHLILVLDGQGVVEVGEDSKKLNREDILFYRADLPIKYYGTNEEFYTCFLTLNGIASTSLLDFYNFPEYFVFRDDAISANLTKICHAADNGTREEILSSHLYTLISDIGILINSDKLPKSFEKAISYIRSNYYKYLPIMEIAEHSGISESLLYEQFQSLANTTPVSFINSVRIDWAKHFLEIKPHLSVAEIGKSVGFTSASYFIECFKREEGITPLKFRKDIQK